MQNEKHNNTIMYWVKLVFIVIGQLLITYLIPIINIIIIIIVRNRNNLSIYNCINIVLATNACCIIGIYNYLKINKNYNKIFNYIKNFGLGICLVTFGISTYEIEINSIGIIPIQIYEICAAVTFLIAFILSIFTQKEENDKDKMIDELEDKKIKDMIDKASKMNHTEIDGNTFKI